MKKVLLTAFVVGAFLISNRSEAQLRVNVNLNIGRPSWGMTNNPYSNQVGDYYYLPEIDSYYDIPRRQFIYFDQGQWLYSNQLPYMYQGYDLARGYKVIVNEPRPYMHADVYRQRYSSYYNQGRARWGNYNNRYDDRYGRRDDDDRFRRGRENQRFDNRRFENDHDRRDNRSWNNGRGNQNVYGNVYGNSNGRYKTERGRD